MSVSDKPIVYYVPCQKDELDGSWFKYPHKPLSEWNNMPLMRYCVEACGFEFKITDGSDYATEADRVQKVIVFNTPYYDGGIHLKKIPKEKKVIFLWEPPSTNNWLYDEELHEQFDRVFTWQDDLVDNEKYFKFFYQNLAVESTEHKPFAERKLCAMINSNKTSDHVTELYSERKRVIEYFDHLGTSEFSLYGVSWNQDEYPSYAGETKDKIATLENYRFSFCYENMYDIEGYVSEKIFDSMAAGCIPIYLGASNIDEFIPDDCYIHRDSFGALEELHEFLKDLDEETFCAFQKRMSAFLKSEASLVFGARHFVEIILKEVLKRDVPSELLSQIGADKARPRESYSRKSDKQKSALQKSPHATAVLRRTNMPAMKAVHLMPDFAAEHPYNLQLVESLRALGLHVKIVRSKNFSIEVSKFGPSIIHLHWLHSYTKTDEDGLPGWKIIFNLAKLIGQLALVRTIGCKLVWTVHELNIPESHHRNIDNFTVKLVGLLSSAIVAHCENARQKIVEAACPTLPDKVKVIPHGHFIDVTENRIDRARARQSLDLDENDFVILFFGLIRPYKGTLELVKAFRKLDLKYAKLLIVGSSVMHHKQCADYIQQIKDVIGDSESVRLMFEFIATEKIQNIMNASDVVAFPYCDIMTSGALIMAMGFAKPCIASRVGCISETLDEKGAFLYDAGDYEGLLRCIRESYYSRESLDEMGRHNLEVARTLDWISIASKTRDIYESCTSA